MDTLPDDVLEAIERLRTCAYLDNAPHELDRHEAEQRMRDLVTVFDHYVGRG